MPISRMGWFGQGMRTMGAYKASQRGFSAIELMIAIIILGMVFMMTLKGSVAISAFRAFVAANQIVQFQQRFQQYVAEYGAVPGDDPGAERRWNIPMALTAVGGVGVSLMGDGIIEGDLDDPVAVNGEQYMAWRELRLAGMVEGDLSLMGQSALPENSFGGFYAVAEDNLGLQQVMCLTRVPGREARLIDTKLDDGNISTGRVRGTSRWDPTYAKNHFSAPDKEPYDPNKTYIICLPYLP